MSIVTIKYSRQWEEYQVPGPDGTEAQVCYTDDKDDAIGTAKAIYGGEVEIKFRRVS